MYLDFERERTRIKYFRILSPKIIDEDGSGKKLRGYEYEPGMILELRPGEIEHKLFLRKYGKPSDAFENFFQNVKLWNYRKRFSFSEWLEMQSPFTFDESGICEFKFESGDRILVGHWMKSKIF